MAGRRALVGLQLCVFVGQLLMDDCAGSVGIMSAPSPPPAPAAASPVQRDLYTHPSSAHIASWIMPGTVASAYVGGALGAALAALDPARPLWKGTYRAAGKCGAGAFMYLSGTAQLSKLAYFDGKTEQRYRFGIHAANGMLVGGLLNAATHGSLSGPRGALLGLAASVPAWFVLEGRHALLGDELAAERRGWDAAAPQPAALPAANVPPQLAAWMERHNQQPPSAAAR